MDMGIAKPCMSMRMWQENPQTYETELEMAYSVASPFSAGVSTVKTSFSTPYDG